MPRRWPTESAVVRPPPVAMIIAMSTGTDVAMHAAGITLMRGDPALVADAIAHFALHLPQDPPEPVPGPCVQRDRYPAGRSGLAQPGGGRRGHGVEQRKRGEPLLLRGWRRPGGVLDPSKPRLQS